MQTKGCVIALGMFDGLHRGHRAVLDACKALAGEMHAESAVYTFIENPKALFRGLPFALQTYEEKERGILDYGIQHVFSEHFTREFAAVPAREFLEGFVRKYEPAGLVAGEDYTFGDRALGTARMLEEFCAEKGLKCIIVPLVMDGGEKISSTRIRAAIKSGDTDSVEHMR